MLILNTFENWNFIFWVYVHITTFLEQEKMRKCSCGPTNLRSLFETSKLLIFATMEINHQQTNGNYSLSILSPSGDVLLSLLLLLL
jgi:hypothetical protein